MAADQDLATASTSLDVGDLAHAAKHLATVAGVDPGNPRADELLARLMAASPNPLELVPLYEGMSYGEVALHAAIRARQGQISEAVSLLLQAQAVRPDVPYEKWLRAWLPTEAIRAKLVLDALFGPLANCLEHDGPTQALAPLLRALSLERPPNSMLAFLTAKALRTTGHVAEAVAVAKSAHTAVPDHLTAVALATALRKSGDLDGALQAFREAVAFDPEDDGAHLDIGDLELNQKHWDAALAAYEQVLAREPHDPWALPSALYVRSTRDHNAAAQERLSVLAHEGNARAAALLARPV